MRWKISVLMVVLALQSCMNKETNDTPKVKESYLLEAADLTKMISRPHIKLIDFRDEDDYENEHLVNAVNIRRSDIEDDSFDYKGMMANKGQIEALFRKLGIKNDDTLVVYDDNGLCNASRLWWILQNYDFHQIKLLHGGLPSWKLAGGQTTDIAPQVTQSHFKLSQNPSMKYYMSKDNVTSALAENAIIVDTRTADEFSGKRQKSGALKGGRIPSGIHIDWADAIDYNGNKLMRSEEELRSIYSVINRTKDEQIIVYCHTGMRSAHTTFVLTQLLGYENVKNYDGSWTEWSRFEELPYEQDSLTTTY